jgi:hypothetical protein
MRVEPGSRKRAVDMKALCANAIATIDQDEGRLAFRAPEEDCTVNGDPMTLHRLIANLAVNALRYAGGGELTLEGNAHGIVARMTDRGPGFHPSLPKACSSHSSAWKGHAAAKPLAPGLALPPRATWRKRMAAR